MQVRSTSFLPGRVGPSILLVMCGGCSCCAVGSASVPGWIDELAAVITRRQGGSGVSRNWHFHGHWIKVGAWRVVNNVIDRGGMGLLAAPVAKTAMIEKVTHCHPACSLQAPNLSSRRLKSQTELRSGLRSRIGRQDIPVNILPAASSCPEWCLQESDRSQRR